MQIFHKNFSLLIVVLSLITCGSALASGIEEEGWEYKVLKSSSLQDSPFLQDLRNAGLTSETILDLQATPRNFTDTRKHSYTVRLIPSSSVAPEEVLKHFKEIFISQEGTLRAHGLNSLDNWLLFTAEVNQQRYYGIGSYRGEGAAQEVADLLSTRCGFVTEVREPSLRSNEGDEELIEFVAKLPSDLGS